MEGGKSEGREDFTNFRLRVGGREKSRFWGWRVRDRRRGVLTMVKGRVDVYNDGEVRGRAWEQM